jgi:hypothetical protein
VLERDHGVRVSAQALDEVTAELAADGLILPMDGRLIGLAVPGPLPDPPGRTDFPGGYLLSSGGRRTR